MAYADIGDLKAALEISGNSLDLQLEQAIDAASRGLDKLAGVRPGGLEPATSPSTRRYTATGSSLVIIDDYASIDAVTSDGTAITDNVTAEPLNAETDNEPYRWLVSDGLFSTDVGAVEVTGTPGWPAVAPQVNQWVLMISARLIKRLREAPFGLVTGSFDGEVMRLAREDPDTELLVGKLARHRPVIA